MRRRSDSSGPSAPWWGRQAAATAQWAVHAVSERWASEHERCMRRYVCSCPGNVTARCWEQHCAVMRQPRCSAAAASCAPSACRAETQTCAAPPSCWGPCPPPDACASSSAERQQQQQRARAAAAAAAAATERRTPGATAARLHALELLPCASWPCWLRWRAAEGDGGGARCAGGGAFGSAVAIRANYPSLEDCAGAAAAACCG